MNILLQNLHPPGLGSLIEITAYETRDVLFGTKRERLIVLRGVIATRSRVLIIGVDDETVTKAEMKG